LSELSDGLTQTVARRISTELKPHLRSFYGGLLRRYLPQVWLFVAENGAATLEVDRHGDCQVSEGQIDDPDVVVTWTNEAFRIAFTTGNRNELPAGTKAPEVEIHSRRGQVAFEQLRKRLGL
jgi:nitrite reductase/ring-hydroxylating ferredoxin subunit